MLARLNKVLAERWSSELISGLEILDRKAKPVRCRACQCDVAEGAEEANALAATGLHPAVAVLLAFARRPHAFRGSYHVMTGALLFEVMLGEGLVFEGTAGDLAACFERLRRGRLTEDDASAWLLGRCRSRAATTRSRAGRVRVCRSVRSSRLAARLVFG